MLQNSKNPKKDKETRSDGPYRETRKAASIFTFLIIAITLWWDMGESEDDDGDNDAGGDDGVCVFACGWWIRK